MTTTAMSERGITINLDIKRQPSKQVHANKSNNLKETKS